jgi:hypothetical protein
MMNASNILHAAEGLLSSAKDKVGSVLSDRKQAVTVRISARNCTTSFPPN